MEALGSGVQKKDLNFQLSTFLGVTYNVKIEDFFFCQRCNMNSRKHSQRRLMKGGGGQGGGVTLYASVQHGASPGVGRGADQEFTGQD